MTNSDTDVLVIGTGPTGSTMALALSTYGVRVRLITRYSWLSNSPRAHITNQRSMEVLRDLGVADEVARFGSRWDLMGDTLFTTSLAGEEIARIRTWGTGDDRHGEYLASSPTGMLDVPQPFMESVLLKSAAERGTNVSFSTEYLSHKQDENGVEAVLRDRLTGREYTVRAKYLIGADGARSRIAEELELPIAGEMARASTAYVQFTADLSRYVEHRPSILYWIVTPNANFGEIGMGLLRAVHPWTEWIAGWGYDPSAGEPDFSPASLRAKIRNLVGDPELEPQIGATSTWSVNQAYATVYSSGRVFCAGDAVHRHPPSGGLGSNTCIQDAYNLAWKLAFVILHGANERLLSTYTAERAPVGKQVVLRANKSRVEFGPLNRAIATNGRVESVAAALSMVSDPSTEGVEVRIALQKALELKNYEFNAHGVELNQRYSSAAVIPDSQAEEETWARDRELFAQSTSRPGAKLPHAWLVNDRGVRISTLDLVGKGAFTVITGLSGTAWVGAVEALGRDALKCVVVGDRSSRDLYGAWQSVREIEEAGALLVRPDGYVAWRHLDAVWERNRALDLLSGALDVILGTSRQR